LQSIPFAAQIALQLDGTLKHKYSNSYFDADKKGTI